MESESNWNKFPVVHLQARMHTYLCWHMIYNSSKSQLVSTLKNILHFQTPIQPEAIIGNMSITRENFKGADETLTQPHLYHPPDPVWEPSCYFFRRWAQWLFKMKW